MDWLLLLARILFVWTFLRAGTLFHLRDRETAIAYSRQMGAPAPEITVILTGIQIIVGSLLILLGFWADLGALLLIAFLVPTNYWMHAYWKLEDPMERQLQHTNFWKNTSMAGGALAFFYLFVEFEDEIGLTLGDPALFAD